MKRKILLAVSAVALMFTSCNRDEGKGENTKKTQKEYLLNRWAYSEQFIEYGGKSGGVEVIRYNDNCSSRKMQWFKEDYLEEWDYVNIDKECEEKIYYLKYKLEGSNLYISDGIEEIKYDLVKVDDIELVYKLKKDYNDDGTEDIITYKFNSK